MSCDLSKLTALVVDHGFFLPLARALGGENGFGRVLYHKPDWEKAYPLLTDGVIGDGFTEIERCADLWRAKDDVDLFIFPDVYHMGLQRELKLQGFPVWGAQSGMMLELNRRFFLDKLKKLGLDVATNETVVGVSALRDYLKDKEDIYIKLSTWRGSWETTHWRSWKQDAHRLDLWAVRFGGARELIRFLCFDAIDTKLEIGGDTFCIDGQWPKTMLHGLENKDSAYFAAVTPKAEMPKELTEIMDTFSPFLKEVQYRCQWCMEVRVADEGNFFIDATTRCGLPSTGSNIDLMSNLAQVLWHGAHGEMVEPKFAHKYAAECMVKVHGDPKAWETIVLPPELVPHLKVYDCCEIDGQIWFPSDDKPIEEVGWLVATGNTPTEVARRMNELADMLPAGADAAVEGLADILREIEEEQAHGIKFSDEPMPEPEVVLEDS